MSLEIKVGDTVKYFQDTRNLDGLEDTSNLAVGAIGEVVEIEEDRSMQVKVLIGTKYYCFHKDELEVISNE